MAFWSFLRGFLPGAPATEPEALGDPERPPSHAPAEPLPDHVQRLLAFGAEGGPSEDVAVRLLAETRASRHEGLVVDALAQRHALAPLPGRLAVAVAGVLLDRGDRSAADRLLAATRTTASLLLRADLLAEGGDFAAAVAAIERALLRDVDLAGARERRLAWRARLGLSEVARRVDLANVTVAVPKARAPFDLVREIGRGGAGVVFAATDRELGRQVALKVYHRPDRDRAQLLHEARVATALEGPGIVRIFDIEPEEGWIVLEWASGGALRDVLRTPSRASLSPLAAWLVPLAQALGRIHDAGWVHHDLKPANVLVAAGLEPWLSDFGNARRLGAPGPPGSFGYVSPERLAGRASDPRDDVYAFGRIIEDVLAAVDETPEAAAWQALAETCVGPGEGRPRDGAALVCQIPR